MFNYLFITNKPDIAKYVESCGVQRIFVDLEINGKEGRQGHLDTVISRHSMEDISKIKSVLNTSELLVRLNPLYEGSEGEIDQAISCGADILMLPMFNSVEEVREFGALIDGRAKFIPLVETISAAEHIDEIHDLDCVDELHIGLNDLHLEMKLKFMFELIANGTVDRMTRKL
ncbi:aldolase, partial [Vibrio xuii]